MFIVASGFLIEARFGRADSKLPFQLNPVSARPNREGSCAATIYKPATPIGVRRFAEKSRI